MWQKIKPYIIGILLPVAVGGLSALLTKDNMDIYNSIQTPKLSPPSILFPIVWTILYILMGVSSTLVYTSDAPKKEKTQALILYGMQLVVNFFWSIVFFNLKAFFLSFVWLVVLWILIILMIISFFRIVKAAGWLQLPYLIWVTFAGYLNLAIYLLNG